MSPATAEDRRHLEQLDRPALQLHQLKRLNSLLATILPHNAFYADKLTSLSLPLGSLEQLSELPFTYKEELADAQQAHRIAPNRTFDYGRYVRFHQTSGTRGRPLIVLDTADDWQWWIDCWQYVLDAAEVTAEDRVLMAFSFGPFIGFWSANDAAAARGCLVIPGGGMSTLSRLELMRATNVTVVFCTPSYALHMAEVAAMHAFDLPELEVRRLIVAGEPGGTVPAIRKRIEGAWNAKVVDHAGATEVGPWGYGDAAGTGLHVLESEFIAEFLSVEDGKPAAEGELAELVLTTLGRTGAPVIRYRTGDLVSPRWPQQGPNRFVLLEGGVLGRADDMMIIRGVNIFPTSIDQIVHGFPEVIEYQMIATRQHEMDHLVVEIEDRMEEPRRVAEELRLRLGLKIEVRTVPIGSLPRYEGKGKRFIDQR